MLARKPYRASARRCDRHGISLLEVLIATFIVVVGLLSLASLIPVGINYNAQARRADYATALGQSSWHVAKVNGWLQPRNDSGIPVWYDWAGNALGGSGGSQSVTDVSVWTGGTSVSTRGYYGDLQVAYRPTQPLGHAVVIDPLGLSSSAYVDPATKTINAHTNMRWFPAFNDISAGDKHIRVPRVTVGRMSQMSYPIYANNTVAIYNGAMPPHMAYRIFTSPDDPYFTDEVDPVAKRRYRLFEIDQSNANRNCGPALNRNEFSYLITLSPNTGETYSNARPMVPYASGANATSGSLPNPVNYGVVYQPREYNVAVAVLHKRRMPNTLVVNKFYEPEDERMAIVTNNPNSTSVAAHQGGFKDGFPNQGGGTIQIWWRDLSDATYPGLQFDAYNLKSGDYVMLYGRWMRFGSANPSGDVLVARWYKVIGTDQAPVKPSQVSSFDTRFTTAPTGWFAREITLQGPDWDFTNFRETRVAIINRVVGVYEKTVRME